MTTPTATDAGTSTGSLARGIAAGALACAVAIPVTPIAWLVCSVMKRALFHKVMHREIALDELHRHGTGTMTANALVGGATGLIAAGIAAWVALTLVRRGHRWAFLTTAGGGFLLGTAVMWRGLTAHGDPSGSAPLAMTAFLLLALAGLGLAEVVVTTPDPRAARRRA